MAAETLGSTLLELPPGPLTVGLSGGSTPGPVYSLLGSREDLPWDRLSFYFADERRVAPTAAGSNYRMVRDTLLRGGHADPDRLFRIRAEQEDPLLAAEEYASLLPERLHLLLLGIGTDGHTASLFPGADALREQRRRVVPTTGPVEPRGRITITPPVIETAGRLIVLARGAAKGAAVREALQGEWRPLACPAQLARRGVWILDREAARQLRS